MRRHAKSEFIVPLCFADLGEQAYQRLMSECAVSDVLRRHGTMMRDMHALHEWNEDLPLGKLHLFATFATGRRRQDPSFCLGTGKVQETLT